MINSFYIRKKKTTRNLYTHIFYIYTIVQFGNDHLKNFSQRSTHLNKYFPLQFFTSFFCNNFFVHFNGILTLAITKVVVMLSHTADPFHIFHYTFIVHNSLYFISCNALQLYSITSEFYYISFFQNNPRLSVLFVNEMPWICAS